MKKEILPLVAILLAASFPGAVFAEHPANLDASPEAPKPTAAPADPASGFSQFLGRWSDVCPADGQKPKNSWQSKYDEECSLVLRSTDKKAQADQGDLSAYDRGYKSASGLYKVLAQGAWAKPGDFEKELGRKTEKMMPDHVTKVDPKLRVINLIYVYLGPGAVKELIGADGKSGKLGVLQKLAHPKDPRNKVSPEDMSRYFNPQAQAEMRGANQSKESEKKSQALARSLEKGLQPVTDDALAGMAQPAAGAFAPSPSGATAAQIAARAEAQRIAQEKGTGLPPAPPPPSPAVESPQAAGAWTFDTSKLKFDPSNWNLNTNAWKPDYKLPDVSKWFANAAPSVAGPAGPAGATGSAASAPAAPPAIIPKRKKSAAAVTKSADVHQSKVDYSKAPDPFVIGDKAKDPFYRSFSMTQPVDLSHADERPLRFGRLSEDRSLMVSEADHQPDTRYLSVFDAHGVRTARVRIELAGGYPKTVSWCGSGSDCYPGRSAFKVLTVFDPAKNPKYDDNQFLATFGKDASFQVSDTGNQNNKKTFTHFHDGAVPDTAVSFGLISGEWSGTMTQK